MVVWFSPNTGLNFWTLGLFFGTVGNLGIFVVNIFFGTVFRSSFKTA